MSKEEREELFQFETFIARLTILIGLTMVSLEGTILSLVVATNPWVS